jgi:hypothetical protein
MAPLGVDRKGNGKASTTRQPGRSWRKGEGVWYMESHPEGVFGVLL